MQCYFFFSNSLKVLGAVFDARTFGVRAATPTLPRALSLLPALHPTQGDLAFDFKPSLFCLSVQAVRKNVQKVFHAVHAPVDSLGHQAVPVPVLRQTVSPEVRHEEAHVHPHGSVYNYIAETTLTVFWATTLYAGGDVAVPASLLPPRS